MRQRLFFILLFIIPLFSFGQYKYTIGLGSTNETNYGAFGGNLRFYFNLSQNLKLNIDYSHYQGVVEKENNETVSHDYREINLNINYLILFGERERFGIYPILGFNYTFGGKNVESSTQSTENFQESVGMNFGLGFSHEFGRFMPYLESRSLISVNSYLLHTAGIAYSFGKS